MDALIKPLLVDLILVGVAVEALLLWAWSRRDGRVPPIGALLPNLLSGACLFLALRFTMSGAEAAWVGASLGGALLAHLLDLVLRLRAARVGAGA
ncbi:MAG: hypothetical protein ACO4AL_00225 [Steroidobacteraceae bacterium]|jgi:hypothetical protein